MQINLKNLVGFSIVVLASATLSASAFADGPFSTYKSVSCEINQPIKGNLEIHRLDSATNTGGFVGVFAPAQGVAKAFVLNEGANGQTDVKFESSDGTFLIDMLLSFQNNVGVGFGMDVKIGTREAVGDRDIQDPKKSPSFCTFQQ